MGLISSIRESLVQRELEGQRTQIDEKRNSQTQKTPEQLRLLIEMSKLTYPSPELTATERRLQFQALSLAYNLAAAQGLIESSAQEPKAQVKPVATPEQVRQFLQEVAGALVDQQAIFFSDEYLLDINEIVGTQVTPSDGNKSILMAGTICWALYEAARDGANKEVCQAIAILVGDLMEERRLMTRKLFIQFLGFVFDTSKKHSHDDAAALKNVSIGIFENLEGRPELTEENRQKILGYISSIENGLRIAYQNSKDYLEKLR